MWHATTKGTPGGDYEELWYLCQFNSYEIASITIQLSSSFLFWKIHEKILDGVKCSQEILLKLIYKTTKFVICTYISGRCLYLGGWIPFPQ